MKKQNKKESCSCETSSCGCGCGCKGTGGAVYGLGFVGACVYYISAATGFWMGVLGVLKALVWPAMLVFEALKFLA